MNRYLFTTIISFIFIISCNKKEEPIIYELFGQQIDTLIIGESFTPTFFITLPPATVSFYLEGPLKDFKGIAGQFYSDNISDSLYIRDDMLFIHKISTFEKNVLEDSFLHMDTLSTTGGGESNVLFYSSRYLGERRDSSYNNSKLRLHERKLK